MDEMEAEGAEWNRPFQVTFWKYPRRVLMRFLILKRKICQEITTTETGIKMLETQQAVGHDWKGTVQDIAQGHHQMRQYLIDMLIQQSTKN
ncbi:hypothetical protein CDAR_113521 [Caerostris darwini]|uniref:Uncharacterized protein n=1 Tax=Caerostris darwini TaxID=1538125 RepID=A0AAV4UEB0_9ARAC|nr:hypothetical protein CDAR_113521 [Caerostris darwini]